MWAASREGVARSVLPLLTATHDADCDGRDADDRDARYHGYGMKSIRSIVEKYNGSMTVKAQDRWFELRILFPVSS